MSDSITISTSTAQWLLAGVVSGFAAVLTTSWMLANKAWVLVQNASQLANRVDQHRRTIYGDQETSEPGLVHRVRDVEDDQRADHAAIERTESDLRHLAHKQREQGEDLEEVKSFVQHEEIRREVEGRPTPIDPVQARYVAVERQVASYPHPPPPLPPRPPRRDPPIAREDSEPPPRVEVVDLEDRPTPNDRPRRR